MNWNGGSSMSGAVINNRFLTRLLTNGEEDIERVSILKEDISNTACELTVLILSISVTFSVTCLTVASLITKSCQQRWPIHSCSFYKVVCYEVWWYILGYVWSQLISVYNSERLIKIGQYLGKLCSNDKGSSFFLTHSVCIMNVTQLATMLPSGVVSRHKLYTRISDWATCWTKTFDTLVIMRHFGGWQTWPVRFNVPLEWHITGHFGGGDDFTGHKTEGQRLGLVNQSKGQRTKLSSLKPYLALLATIVRKHYCRFLVSRNLGDFWIV